MEKNIVKKIISAILFVVIIATGFCVYAREDSNVNFVSVNQTVYAIGSVSIKDGYELESKKIGTLKKGESINRIAIGDNGFSRVKYNGKIAYISTDYLTTSTPEEINKQIEQQPVNPEETKQPEVKQDKVVLSNDCTLKSLKILEPEIKDFNFDVNVKKYSFEVAKEIQSLNIEAIPNSEKATVRIEGNVDFSIGKNIIEIVITAEDGSTNVYTIEVNKSEDEPKIDNEGEMEENILDNNATNKKNNKYIICGITLVIAISLIVFCKYKKQNGRR